MLRVAVLGAAGRMGATVCRAVEGAGDLDLVSAVDPGIAGEDLGRAVSGLGAASSGLRAAGSVEDLDPAGIDVAVDFTVADSARSNLSWCAANGVHAVCGTTGLGPGDIETMREEFGPDRPANAVLSANFSIGAALMMRCAEICAPFFSGIEVIELHHERKKDAPSGTAIATSERMERARAERGAGELVPDPTERETMPGTRGGARESGIHLHSVRLPGLVAHEEVLFGALGETLTLRHDSTDRESFMPGVLLAVRRVVELEGLTVGIDGLLGL